MWGQEHLVTELSNGCGTKSIIPGSKGLALAKTPDRHLVRTSARTCKVEKTLPFKGILQNSPETLGNKINPNMSPNSVKKNSVRVTPQKPLIFMKRPSPLRLWCSHISCTPCVAQHGAIRGNSSITPAHSAVWPLQVEAFATMSRNFSSLRCLRNDALTSILVFLMWGFLAVNGRVVRSIAGPDLDIATHLPSNIREVLVSIVFVLLQVLLSMPAILLQVLKSVPGGLGFKGTWVGAIISSCIGTVQASLGAFVVPRVAERVTSSKHVDV